MDLQNFNIILFDEFETLDAFGPAEVIGQFSEIYNLEYYSFSGGHVTSKQKIKVSTLPFNKMSKTDVLMIPGGHGTRTLVDDKVFIQELKNLVQEAKYVLTVCTGSALLARTNLLNGKNATTNKKAFEWVCSQGIEVNWKKQARWVCDGNIYTSSGVSAGIDMTLGFISELFGEKLAEDASNHIEYIWNKDKNNDPFSLA